jgi:archaetidylinositol phosphate synthase
MHLWRERLNRWIAPLARRISLSPNKITFLALTINLAAAAALAARPYGPWRFPLAALLISAGGFLDALDGAVARAQGRASRFGDFLDHFCDRLSDVAILVGWCIGTRVSLAIAVPGVIAAMLNGYIGTQSEATFGKRSYKGTGRGEFILAAFALPLIQFTLMRTEMDEARFGGLTVAEWLTATVAVFAVVGIVERFVEAIRLGKAS